MAEKPDKQKRKKINWTPEKVMSASALLISLVSVIALLYELHLAREENELIRKQQSASVLPHLRLSLSNSPNDYRMTFVNKGVGPAFIKAVEFSVNDSLKFERSDFFINYLNQLVYKNEGIRVRVSTYSFQAGDVITANEELDIFRLRDTNGRELLLHYMDSIDWNYSITYEDVYGARWNLNFDSEFPAPIEEER